ncbi:MAG: hypothetical protein ACREAF_03165 [Nitrosopumilaceae archaeon]
MHLRRFFSYIKPVAVEMVSRGKIVIGAAFAGLFAMLAGFVYYANLDNPQLEKVELELADVRLLDVNSVDQRANLEVVFLVSNPGEKTTTVSSIRYELFVNDKNVGNGEYSVEDVALSGRALVSPGQQIHFSSTFNLVYTNQIADEYSAVTNNETVKYSVRGMATIKSALSEIDKQFESVLG